MTIAALRAVLHEEHPGPQPPAPWIPHTAHRRQETTMSQPIPAPRDPRTPPPAAALRPVPAAPTSPAFEAALQSEALPIGKLLAWAEQHDDKTVRRHAEQARTALAALRDRHSSDAELTEIDRETAALQRRMSELRQRRAELQPKKATRKSGTTAVGRDHDPATVRAWAAEQGIEVAPLGRVPQAIVDQWRTATGGSA